MKKIIGVLFLLAVVLFSGCAGLRIPAPHAPITPLAEPVIAPSTLTVPVIISLDAVLGSLGAEQSRERLSGSLRRFLTRQALKNETRLVQNKFVRQQLDQVWSSVQKPIPLQNGLALLLDPEALSVSVLPDQEESVTLILGMRAQPKIVGAAVQPSPKPLPEIAITPAPPKSGFHIALESELPYDQLGREMTDRLKGTTYGGKDGSVMLEKVRVYGSDQALVAAVDVKGSANGTIYLYGTPVYDPAARSLALVDPDYTLETLEVLSRSADWLLHSGLREKLTRRAVWPAGEKIDAARESITAALNRQYGQLVISGRITNMRPVAVGLTATGIRTVVEADGTVEVKMQ